MSDHPNQYDFDLAHFIAEDLAKADPADPAEAVSVIAAALVGWRDQLGRPVPTDDGCKNYMVTGHLTTYWSATVRARNSIHAREVYDNDEGDTYTAFENDYDSSVIDDVLELS